MRYVDDFVILHRSSKRLEFFKKEIINFLKDIKLELHPQKSTIIPLQKGITFLGYRVFYRYKLLRKRNQHHFWRQFESKLQTYKEGNISEKILREQLEGWFGYARWANTHKLRERINKRVEEVVIKEEISHLKKIF